MIYSFIMGDDTLNTHDEKFINRSKHRIKLRHSVNLKLTHLKGLQRLLKGLAMPLIYFLVTFQLNDTVLIL